ncbi:MAG: AAA family ATPase, partial [Chloroflexota bacterium]|nr:AAA family ATPase [Chloroflexota bacterium]
MEALQVYMPMDWRQAMARGETLPERVEGAALFADISGFTPLTEALAKELGPQRGAEELTEYLNLVYNALIAELHRFGGSVIGFAGDAITCWLDGDDGARAMACGFAMQDAMGQFDQIKTAAGTTITLAMKVAVTVGPARRFVVGDPQIQLIDVLAGSTLDNLAATEHHANKGEVVLGPAAAASLGERIAIKEWRTDEQTGQRFAVLDRLLTEVEETPWPPLPSDGLNEKQVRPWLLAPVYERLRMGGGEFLAELRPTVALFTRFSGIDYDRDEAAGRKLDNFIRRVQGILLRYGGTLVQLTLGDKGSYLYAAFGAPIAHEDDATRASSAALELRTLVEASEDIEEGQIGITQGRMRTGAYGSTTRRSYGVLGDAVNLSARLMMAAKPGQILVSDAARRATSNDFSWEELPNIRVKGKSEPVTLSSLLGKLGCPSLHHQQSRYSLPMVGRQEELTRVEEKIAQVLEGQGQVVGITAEAGMGKSRLTAEVVRRASESGLVGYGGEAQSYGTTTSYLVWHSVWRSFFSLDASLSVEEQVEKLRVKLLEINPALLPRLPLLGAVLNLSIPDNELTRSMDAKLRKSSLEALLVDCLRARAQQMSLLIVLEDCHWMDSLSHDLLQVVARAIARLPVLLLLVYRPSEIERSQVPEVRQLPYFTEIALQQFTVEEAEQLIALKLAQFFAAETAVPQHLVERVTSHAEGNPFYIDEFLNYVHDRGIDPQDTAAVAELELPASLHSLVLSRVDQLSEGRKITLKVASVIGRLFRTSMLWGVHPQSKAFDRVRRDLNVLSELDFTPLDTPDPEETYLFKHIVTQEVAYESLPFATRAMLHNQIGQYIEQGYADTLDQFVDLLAHHYWHSDNDKKKREYLFKAGDAAQADYANEAAITYYERLIPLLEQSSQGAVMLKLGKVLELVGEWDRAGEQYEQALALAEQLNDTSARAWCQLSTAELLRKRGKYTDAADWLELARAGFEGLADQEGV